MSFAAAMTSASLHSQRAPARRNARVELDDARDRAESLLARHLGPGSHVAEDRRCAVRSENKSDARWKKLPSIGSPPVRTLAPLDLASWTWRWTFSTALLWMSGPCVMPSSKPLPTCHISEISRRDTDLERVDLLDKTAAELGVDRRVDEEAVHADAGLAARAELAGDRAVDGRVNVGVVEHNEGSIAAELERKLLERRGRLLGQDLADVGRACAGQTR